MRTLTNENNENGNTNITNVYVNTLENGEAIEIEQVGTTTANKVNLAFKQNTTQASSVANNDLILIADNATGKVVKYVEANLVGQVLTATTPIEINNNVISTTFTKSSTDHLLNKTITSFVGNSLSNITTPSAGGTLALTSQFLTGPNFGTAATPIRTNTFGSIYQPTILNGSSIALGGKITNQIQIKGGNPQASLNSDIQFQDNNSQICGNVGFTAGKLQLINNNSTDTQIGSYGNYKLEFVSDTQFKASGVNNFNDGTITNLTSLNGHSIPTDTTPLVSKTSTTIFTNKSFNDEAQFNTGLKVYNGGTSGGHVDFYNTSLASNKMRLKAQDSLATGGGGTLLLPNVAGTLGLKADIDTNTTAIATNASNISNNASSIISNTNNIATNASNISTNTTNILTNTGNITANTGNISNNASSIISNTNNIATNASNISTNTTNILTNTGNISANTGNISSLLNAGYITSSSVDTLTNKSLSYSQLTGTPTIPDTTTASNFGTSSSSNIIVGSTTKTLELQGTSIDIEDKDGTSIIEITDSDTKFKGTDISIIGRNATTSPKIYFTNFTNPFTSWIRLVGQADAGASGTHTLTLPQATGTLALTSDIPSAGNGIFTIAGSFTSKVATATQCNEYIFSSGVNANGSCRIVLQSDTNNPTGGPDDKNTEILFKKENDLVQGSIGMGRPGTETDDNQMIIDCKTFSDGIKLQTQGTTRLSIEPTQIVASKKIVANGGIETTSINLNNPAHVDIYTPEIEVSTLTDDNTFIEMRSGTGNSSSTKVSTIKFYNKNNTKSAFIGLDTDNKLHLTNNSFGGNNLKVGSSGIDVEALGISSGNASYPISWKSNIMTTYYAYLYNVASGNGWHLNAVGDQFLCKTNRDILYYNTDLIGNGSLITGYTKPPLGDIYCEDIFCDELNYQTCNTCSDARLKKNLKPIENAIETLNKLTPLLYDKKVKDETDIWGNEYIPDSGFIAQDVYNQVPELRFIVNNVADDIPENFDSSGNLIRDCIGWDIVEDKHATSVPVDSPPDASGNPNPDAGKQLTEATYKKVLNPDKKLSINYEELTAYLVKGIQEQDVRIKHLENIITKLTSSASFANFKKII